MLSDKIEDDNILFLDVRSYFNNIRFVVVFNMSSLFKGFFYFYNLLVILIPWYAFNIIYITSFIIENR